MELTKQRIYHDIVNEQKLCSHERAELTTKCCGFFKKARDTIPTKLFLFYLCHNSRVLLYRIVYWCGYIKYTEDAVDYNTNKPRVL